LEETAQDLPPIILLSGVATGEPGEPTERDPPLTREVRPRPRVRSSKVAVGRDEESDPDMVLAGTLRVHLKISDIAALSTDVLVNSTSAGTLLGGGTVAQALAAAGGPALIADIQAKYPRGLGSAEVAVTDGGSLKCKHVFHVACPQWSTDAADVLKRKITLCLIEADNRRLGEIAFPAIGTGGLGYPADQAVRAMFSGVEDFVRQKPQSSVVSVSFVVHPSDANAVAAFKQEFQNRSGSPIKNLVEEGSPPEKQEPFLHAVFKSVSSRMTVFT
jgi:O-acetyl-ADP-ribose deacetylase